MIIFNAENASIRAGYDGKCRDKRLGDGKLGQ